MAADPCAGVDPAAWLSRMPAATGARVSGIAWPVATARGRGVVTTRPCAAGDELFAVPQAAALTPARCACLLSCVASDPVFVRQHSLDDDSPLAVALTLLLLRMVRQGGASGAALPPAWLLDYSDLLPRLDGELAGLPLVWQPRQLAWLMDGGASGSCTAGRARWELEWRDGLLPSLRTHAAACHAASGAVGHVAGGGASAATCPAVWLCGAAASDWLWARACTQSRTFVNGWDGDPMFMCAGVADMLSVVMVPVGDMCNHGGAKEVNGEGEWVPGCPTAGGMEEGWYVVHATRDLGAGEEVVISYGDRDGWDMLETYGFLAPGAVMATMEVQLGVAGGDGAGGGARNLNLLPRLLGAPVSPTTTSGGGGSDVTWEGWCAWRWEDLAPAHAAIAALRTRLWEDCGSMTEVHVPAIPPEGGDEVDADADGGMDPHAQSMLLLRSVVLDDDDVAMLMGPGGGSIGLIRVDRMERPVSRGNELRVLRLLYLLCVHLLHDAVQALRRPEDGCDTAAGPGSRVDTGAEAGGAPTDRLRALYTPLATLLASCGEGAPPPAPHRVLQEVERVAAAEQELGGSGSGSGWGVEPGAAAHLDHDELRWSLACAYRRWRLAAVCRQLAHVCRMVAVAFPHAVVKAG